VGVLFCDGRAGKRGEQALVCLRHTRSAISPVLLPPHACSPVPRTWTSAHLLSLERFKKKIKTSHLLTHFIQAERGAALLGDGEFLPFAFPAWFPFPSGFAPGIKGGKEKCQLARI